MNLAGANGGYRRAEKITLLCLLGNIALCLFKGFAGYLGGSKAMMADAYHSLSDIIATLVVYFSLKIAQKPVDACHHYGHGKVEPLCAAFVGVTLVLASGYILKDILVTIASGLFPPPSLIALIAAVISILVKESMFRITFAEGKRINSDAVIANAWDHRSDAYSSIGTFAGILGSIAGGALNIPALQYLDPVAGIVVALLIAKFAIKILKEAVKKLMDSSPEEEKIAVFLETLQDIDEIEAISWIKARYVGNNLMVDLAIEVDADKTIEQGHMIALAAKQMLMDKYDDIEDVIVHINPYYLLP